MRSALLSQTHGEFTRHFTATMADTNHLLSVPLPIYSMVLEAECAAPLPVGAEEILLLLFMIFVSYA